MVLTIQDSTASRIRHAEAIQRFVNERRGGAIWGLDEYCRWDHFIRFLS